MNILIADDHLIIFQALKLLLEPEGYAVFGPARSELEIRESFQTHPIDIVILDIALDATNGLLLIPELVAANGVMVVVFSGNLDSANGILSRKLGAGAVISKADDVTEILRAIKQGSDEVIYLSQSVASMIIEPTDPDIHLSPRQQAILRLMDMGETNKEIGHLLQIAQPTVSFHIKEIRTKLGVDHNSKILSAARTRNLL